MNSIPLPFIGRSVDPVCSPAAHDDGSGQSAQCLLQAIALLARQTRFENTFKLCLALDPWQLHDNVIGETAQQLGLRSSVPEAPGIVSGMAAAIASVRTCAPDCFSFVPVVIICSSLRFDRAHFVQRTVSVLKCQ